MAIGSPALLYVDWDTRIINVAKDYMSIVQLLPTEIRELNTITLHSDLRDLEDDEEGIPFLTTHNFVGPITVGGVSLAQVIEIINGYTITFEENSPAGSPPCPIPYAVNLAGSNNNVADVTNVNSVSIRSANSAGLTFSKQIEDQSFEDARVWINSVSGRAGTQFPLGTPGAPVNNPVDAIAIINLRKLPTRMHLTGEINILVDIGENINFEGDSRLTAKINFGVSGSPPQAVDITGNTYTSCEISGFIFGPGTYNTCILRNLEGYCGTADNCAIAGTITLDTAGGDYVFNGCFAANTSTPTVDCGGAMGVNLSIRGYRGAFTLTNFSDPANVAAIDLNGGHCTLDSTCTAGTIVVIGTGQLTDNSTGTTTVIDTGLVEGNAGARAFGGM